MEIRIVVGEESHHMKSSRSKKQILLIAAATLLFSLPAFSQSPHGDNFKIECSNCHITESWNIISKAMKFSHNSTSFPLTGQHAEVSCRSCHRSLIFSDANVECNSCHRDIHQNTLGQNCSRCHSTRTWLVSDINQLHQATRFPLVGAHQNVDCASCHAGYSKFYFPPLDISCFNCHSKEYYAATSPNHIQSGFSTQCQECHNMVTAAWSGGNFDHSFFPLAGGHNISNCFACHKQGGSFNGLSTACYSCHSSNFASAANPNHVALSLPTNCSMCHTTNPGWTPATFPIHSNYYAITGAHTSLSCDRCHNGNYNAAPTTCYGCHQSDYNSTTNPAHSSAGFPTDCTQCHTQAAWSPSTFSHTQFPISSGRHASPPLLCSQCHTSVSNFSVFSCTTGGCHSQAETDSRHDGVNGYVYSATSCYSCHPTGGGGD